MPLPLPTTEDQRKIHAEVNQLVNQRIWLTTIAVTVFLFITQWQIQKVIPGQKVGAFIYGASFLLIGVLLAPFILMHLLTYMLRVLTTYLKATDASEWEKSWYSFRHRFGYWGYTKSIALLFMLFIFCSTVFPLLLGYAFSLTIQPVAGLIMCIGFGLLCIFTSCLSCVSCYQVRQADPSGGCKR